MYGNVVDMYGDVKNIKIDVPDISQRVETLKLAQKDLLGYYFIAVAGLY
jgi:hypothetical protein